MAILIHPSLRAEQKVESNVSYGPHSRNVMDIYWDTEKKNAPIVFTIHGGGFRNGSKSYCNPDMQKLYRDKGCVIVSPNYRLLKEGTSIEIQDCAIDCAMAVAWMQANAAKYGGDPKRIVATGGSAGGYLSAAIAYRKNWDWPDFAKHKPKQLNIVGWYGDSPAIPADAKNSLRKNDPPAFMIYGQKEHPKTPAKLGHDMQARLKEAGIWNSFFYIEKAGHVPGKRILINARQRNAAVFKAFDKFLDLVCYGKGKPASGQFQKIKP